MEGDAERTVTGVAELDQAGADDVSFCALASYRARVAQTRAAAVIVARDFEPPAGLRDGITWIRVDNPYLGLADAVSFFHPVTAPLPGIHPTAVVAESATVTESATVGARAVIEDGAFVGSGTSIGAACVLGQDCRIGEGCALFPGVLVYPGVELGDRVIVHAGAVLGADGFGYAHSPMGHTKIPQVGTLVIEDDVEIGANSCVDRGALGKTHIGRGTKIDNLVQIGHNCHVGAHSILCGQVGLGGSTTIGEGVMIGGQAGVAGHMSVGDGAMLAAASGVTNDVAAGQQVAGYPHLEVATWRRAMAALRSLPELVRRVRRLEAAVGSTDKEDE